MVSTNPRNANEVDRMVVYMDFAEKISAPVSSRKQQGLMTTKLPEAKLCEIQNLGVGLTAGLEKLEMMIDIMKSRSLYSS